MSYSRGTEDVFSPNIDLLFSEIPSTKAKRCELIVLVIMVVPDADFEAGFWIIR